MNELENLDHRGQQAAADLRARAAARPRPAFDPADADLLPAPARIRDHRSRRPFLAAAAVVLLVLAGGLALVIRHQDGDGDGPASPTTTTEPPRPFVATDLPRGLAFTGAVGPQARGGTKEFSPLQVYGPSIDRPELGVGMLIDESNTYDDTKKVEVEGRTVLTADDAGMGKRVVIVRRGKRAVFAMSPVLDRATLADVAEGAEVGPTEVNVPSDVLPDGFRRLAEEPDPLGPLGVLGLRNGGVEGSLAVYTRATTTTKGSAVPDDLGFVSVSSSEGDQARLEAVRLWSTDVSASTVRAKPALVTSSSVPAGPGAPQLTVRVITWIERPGELLRVSGYGVSVAELTSVAEGVRPVGDKEWSDLVERTKLGEFADASGPDAASPAVEVGRGRFADGTAWRLAVRPGDVATDGTGGQAFATPELTVALTDSTDSSSGTSSASPEVDVAFRSTATLHQGGRHFAAGILGRSVDAVELRRADGSVIGRPQMVEGNGFRAWVAELTDDPTTVVALGADGRELDRIALSNFDGNESPQVSGGSTQATVPVPAPSVVPGN